MLLIIFLGLIAKLALVSGDCDVGIKVVENFDFFKVGIAVWTRSLKQAAVKTAACVLYFICGSINDHSIERMRLYVPVII
jgi:hypothetical protein